MLILPTHWPCDSWMLPNLLATALSPLLESAPMSGEAAKSRSALSGSIFDDSALFIDRDLSLIEFQRRVFGEARDESNPLLERLNFLSIVGRFLEHSRIYFFANGGKEELYIGSADLRPRNLDRRVEVLAPVEHPQLLGRIRDEILALYLADNVKARELQSDGSYVRLRYGEGEPPISIQQLLAEGMNIDRTR